MAYVIKTPAYYMIDHPPPADHKTPVVGTGKGLHTAFLNADFIQGISVSRGDEGAVVSNFRTIRLAGGEEYYVEADQVLRVYEQLASRQMLAFPLEALSLKDL